MQTFTLPQHLGGDPKRDVFIYNYQSSANTEKSKVALSHHVVSFLQEGTKTVFLSNERVRVEPNQFMLLKSGHCLMTERISAENKYRSVLLFFDDSALRDFCTKHGIVPHTHPSLSPILTLEYDDFITHFVASLSLFHNNYALSKLKFEEFMLYCLEKHGTAIANFCIAHHAPFQRRLHNVVENALHQKLSVEEMAFLCNMSLSTFKREFYKHYRTSPQRWLHEQRLQRAAFLLKVEQQRPSDIFIDIGFENLSSFTQSFKKRFGVTPKKYQAIED